MSFFRRSRRSTHPSQADLSAYVDGELPVAPARTIAHHAETCATCRVDLDALQETKSLLANLPRTALPHSFTLSQAQAGIRRAAPQQPAALRFAPAMTLSLLAALLLIDVVSPSSSHDQTATSANNVPIAAKSAAESASPAQRSLQTAPAGGNVPSAAPAPAGGAAGAAADSAAPVAPAQPSIVSQGAPSTAQADGLPGPGTAVAEQAARSALVAPTASIAPPVPPAISGVTTPNGQPFQLPSPTTAVLTVQHQNGSGVGLLRLLEILAAAGFIVSLLIVAWPKFTRKEP